MWSLQPPVHGLFHHVRLHWQVLVYDCRGMDVEMQSLQPLLALCFTNVLVCQFMAS